jgi:hypothetical protein
VGSLVGGIVLTTLGHDRRLEAVPRTAVGVAE